MNIFNANGDINKNLVKLAKSLNLELWIHEDVFEDEDRLFTVSELDENGEAECEWLFSYKVSDKGELFYNGNIYFSQKEELPEWIESGEKVKELLHFVAKTQKEENH